jgi:hypothetical protein
LRCCLQDHPKILSVLLDGTSIPFRKEVLKSGFLGPRSPRHDERDERPHEVDPLMQQDRSLDALERRPLGELPMGDAEFEFVGGDAQGERYPEELPSSWAGPKTAASCLSSASDTPQSLRATS